MSPSAAAAAPPSPQEIQRKLSVHSTAKPKKSPPISQAHVSGTESDSDSVLSPDLLSPTHSQSLGSSGALMPGSGSQPPLSSIAERRSGSGEESEEDDEEEEDPWRTADKSQRTQDSIDEGVIKSGYLWKKGERRKTWKKRWFVLRPAHLAYYKTSAEYQLLRLLNLADVHSCTQVVLKKHSYTFGVVTSVRTFYLQAPSPEEVQQWVVAIQDARGTLMMTSTQNSLTTPPIPIPAAQTSSRRAIVTPSPPSHPSHAQNITSSDSEDVSPSAQRTYSTSSQNRPVIASSPTQLQGAPRDSTAKVVLSGYLMKCGSKRHNWRKRWFVLYSEKLVYSGSHMDRKTHRQFSVSEILDALEFDMHTHKHNAGVPPPALSTQPSPSSAENRKSAHGPYTFKIVTTKRTLVLCAPSEEEEIKWLSAVRALIARRTGAGVVPGEASSGNASKPAAGAIDGGQSGPTSSSGLRHKVRNLSISGPSGIPTAPISDG
ncbi:PH-domain-containing protein [Gyrodon lividus]|nr:PH-domain-containing protein [Gyrodon lividus]